MTAPKFIDIGGQRFVRRELLRRHREQPAAALLQLFDWLLQSADLRARAFCSQASEEQGKAALETEVLAVSMACCTTVGSHA